MIAEVRSDQGAGVPVVYVPGIDGSGGMLMGTTETLAARFRLLCLRYREESSKERDTYPDLAASVMQRIEERGIERAILLAESFGTAVAVQAAVDHPERVAGLALVNGFVHYPARLRLAVSRWGLSVLPAGLLRWGRKLIGARTLFGAMSQPEVEERLLADNDEWYVADQVRRMHMIASLDLRPRLPEVGQPVAIFVSDRDRVVPSMSQGELMAARLPDAELQVIRGGGHVILPLSTLPWVEWLDALAVRAGWGA